MTREIDARISTLAAARDRRSSDKRTAVEDAIKRLRDRNETITFIAVANEAGVSRQYLYNNFEAEIRNERSESRAASTVIDGVTVPARTPDEARHIEAALRNRITRLEAELRQTRVAEEKAVKTAERERGKAEHWRRLYETAISRRPADR